jgi:hypothetical protein
MNGHLRAILLRYLVSSAFVVAPAGVACGQPAPRVLIEGFRTTDTLTRQAAVAVRRGLRARVDSTHLWVMSTAEIDAHRAAGTPDDFGGAWNWAGVREASKVYRAAAVIDIVAVRSGKGVALRYVRVERHAGPVVSLGVVRAGTLDAAVSTLVERLVNDKHLLTLAERQSPDT